MINLKLQPHFASVYLGNFYLSNLQLIERCHSTVKFTNSFHITHSNNHCSNGKIIWDYLHKVIFPLVGPWKYNNTKNTIPFSVSKISFIFLMTHIDSTNDQNVCVELFKLYLHINDQATHQRKT